MSDDRQRWRAGLELTAVFILDLAAVLFCYEIVYPFYARYARHDQWAAALAFLTCGIFGLLVSLGWAVAHELRRQQRQPPDRSE